MIMASPAHLFEDPKFERTAIKITEVWFGSIVARVVKVLFDVHKQSLAVIRSKLKLPPKELRASLAALIQHGLVAVESPLPGRTTYSIVKKHLFYILRRNKYLWTVQQKLDMNAELVLDKYFEVGRASASQLIVATCCTLGMREDVSDHHVVMRDALQQLVQHQYMRQYDPVEPDNTFILPSKLLDLQLIKAEVSRRLQQVELCRSLPDRDLFPDAAITYTINYDAFHLQWRNELLTTCLLRRCGSDCAEVFQSMMSAGYEPVQDKWRTDVPVTTAHVKQALPRLQHVEQCVTLLETESLGCVRRVGIGGGGGEYVLSVSNFVDNAAKEFGAKRIKDKLGSKAARIFRLVLHNDVTGADVIATSSLLDKKESDMLINSLLTKNYCHVHDLRKAALPAQSANNQILYTVNFPEVVRQMSRECFKEVYNLLRKKELLSASNSCLMEKKTRLDAIVDNMAKSGATQAQIQEVEDTITESERTAITKWVRNQDELLTVVAAITEDVFLLELYTRYSPDMDNKDVGR